MTHTKYHGSGRLYTEMELQDREAAFAGRYVVEGYFRRKQTLADGTLLREPLILPYRKYHGRG